VGTGSKTKSADRDFTRKADLLFSETVIFFFGECFAAPVSLSFVPGLHSLSIVDQYNR